MNRRTISLASSVSWASFLGGVAIAAMLGAAAWFAMERLKRPMEPQAAAPAHQDGHAIEPGHDHGDHGHAHDEANMVEISDQAARSLQTKKVFLSTFERTIAVPGMVVERPGRSQIQITAPLTGNVSRIYATDGEAVAPGAPLFDIDLTHDELVTAQRDFLRTSEELHVVEREIARLESVDEGVVPGRRIIEQRYEKQKLEAALRAQRQGLYLHHLTEQQVDEIQSSRTLLQNVTVSAPRYPDENTCEGDHLFHVQRLVVQQGQHVQEGAALCILADHCELFIEGKAFEDDAEFLRRAASEGWPITAIPLVEGRSTSPIEGLSLLYLSDQIDQDSRAFHFYVRLPNRIALDRTVEGGKRHQQWRFQPGQRIELLAPVEQWSDRLVVPVDAVVQEGAESYVFVREGAHYDRTPVHVEYRDQRSAVIAADGTVRPGDEIVVQGAYQLQLTLLSRTRGAVDPHAGHNH